MELAKNSVNSILVKIIIETGTRHAVFREILLGSLVKLLS